MPIKDEQVVALVNGSTDAAQLESDEVWLAPGPKPVVLPPPPDPTEFSFGDDEGQGG